MKTPLSSLILLNIRVCFFVYFLELKIITYTTYLFFRSIYKLCLTNSFFIYDVFIFFSYKTLSQNKLLTC